MSDETAEPVVDESEQATETGSAPDTKAASEKPEDGDGKPQKHTVPLQTFLQTRDDLKESKRQLQELSKELEGLKAKLDPKPGQAPLDADRRKAVKELLEDVEGERLRYVDELRERESLAYEARLDVSEEMVREFAVEKGLPSKDSFINRFGYNVMAEIKEDAKLLRRWNAGDLSVVKTACNRHLSEYAGELRKGNGQPAADSKIATKRAVAKLPTPLSGGSGVSASPPPRKEGDVGLTKDVHERAFAHLREHIANS